MAQISSYSYFWIKELRPWNFPQISTWFDRLTPVSWVARMACGRAVKTWPFFKIFPWGIHDDDQPGDGTGHLQRPLGND